MADADLRRALQRGGVQRAVPPEPGQGPDRPVRRLRSPHPDRVRRRPCPGPRGGRPGRRAGRAPGRHAGPVRRPPASADEHLDDDQRHGDVAAGPVPGRRRGAGRGHRRADRHHAERHHQGVPVPRHLRLPAAPLGAADHRRDRLHGGPYAQVEPGQRMQLPPPGGRGDPGAGDRVLAVHRDDRAGRRPRLRAGPPGPDGRGGRADLVLRQRRRPFCRGDVQDAGVRPALGRDHPGTIRDRRPGPATVPLRRAGQLARPHRGAAGEQHPADRPGDAGCHPLEGRPGPCHPAASVE